MSKYRLLMLLAVCTVTAGSASVVEEVDVTIGNIGWELKPSRPTVHLPNSMVRFHPFRADVRDDQIAYFPLTIGSRRSAGSFSVMPAEGPLTYDHEQATPYHYSVWLAHLGPSFRSEH